MIMNFNNGFSLQLDNEHIDIVIDIFLLTCQGQPSYLATRGFITFYKFLVNPDQRPNNQLISKRFLYNKANITKIGISKYFNSNGYYYIIMIK